MTSNASGSPLPNLSAADWLRRAETQAVLAAIEMGGFSARVVGGAVRNALLGTPVKDIDIATTAVPSEVARLVAQAGLKSVPTGIEHGTLTVIAGHHPFEVTTLRSDVEADGRRATVAFTTDWAADASRRDFTINALYCDKAGVVFDPLGGYADLEARRVRFIGDAHDRIREDYLRILRFFRFSAEYADGAPDAAGLAASRELAGGIARLSPERIRGEMLRLLAAPRALDLVREMDGAGVLGQIFTTGTGTGTDTDRLARFIALEAFVAKDADPLMRLAALAASKPGEANGMRDRLRLSNADTERLARAAMAAHAILRSDASEAADRVTLYRHGAEAYRDGLMLASCAGCGLRDVEALGRRLSLPQRWPVPDLPVRGADIMEAGLVSGPAVGRVLRDFEAWWIAEGFPSERTRLAYALSRLVKRERGES